MHNCTMYMFSKVKIRQFCNKVPICKKCNLNYSNFPTKQKGMNQILIQTPIDTFNSSISRKSVQVPEPFQQQLPYTKVCCFTSQPTSQYDFIYLLSYIFETVRDFLYKLGMKRHLHLVEIILYRSVKSWNLKKTNN